MSHSKFISSLNFRMLSLILVLSLALANHDEHEQEEPEKPQVTDEQAMAAMDNLRKNIAEKMTADLRQMKGVCKPELLRFLGLERDNSVVERPYLAISDETDYCRRNKYTCCTLKELDIAAHHFGKTVKQLRSMFEPVEELLVLFEGDRYKQMIDELDFTDENVFETCRVYSENLMDNTGHTYELLEGQFIRDSVEEINSLLVEAEFFIKRQLWFYGNIICSACSPFEQENFTFDTEKMILKTRIHTCNEILDMFEFELRLMKAYQLFLKPFSDLYRCAKGARKETVPPELPTIELKDIMELQANFDQCYFKIHHTNPHCVKICEKDPSEFVLHHKLRDVYTSALRFYFPILTPQSVDEFYSFIKQQPFEEHYPRQIKFFHAEGISRRKFTLELSEKGTNIFSNEFSKKYEKRMG